MATRQTRCARWVANPLVGRETQKMGLMEGGECECDYVRMRGTVTLSNPWLKLACMRAMSASRSKLMLHS